MTQLEVDFRPGMQEGYTGKPEVGVRCFGDISLGLILETLRLEMVLRPRADHGAAR